MELEDDFDVLDPDDLMECPYDKHHQIKASRFPYHLVKCKKSNPEVAKKFATCPFNARHLVPHADLSDHIVKCHDKGFIEQDLVNQASGFQREQMNAMSTWQAPPCEEDWETESSEQSDSPFVWGMTSSVINSSSTTFKQKNCLPSGVRAPESFPYAVSSTGYVLDPDDLMECPYDKHHRIKASRFPYHLVKCKKSNPEVAKKFATCPFNARHLVPHADLSDHIVKCHDKGFIEQDLVNQASGFQREQMNAMSTWQAPPCEEDWETESSEQSDSPFVWGMTSSVTNSSSTTFKQKNCLPSGVRAPESFPYAVSSTGYVLDPDDLMECPYDKHHRIKASRFPYHLVKCKKSNPEVAKKFATCPFNARHLVPHADLSDHIVKCHDKGFIEQDLVNQASGLQREQMNAMSTWQAPPCEEDWETELSEQSDSPFIWGMTNSVTNRKHPDHTFAASSFKP
ncbi:uncharacterized protein [Nyctibius grandis]|uniref:uncharacterized protein n=1 Tax=Nyctibius grandis TaxID=48427 RepID=UPI0035BC45F1